MVRSKDFLMLKSRIKEVLEYHLYHKCREIYGRELKVMTMRSALLHGNGIRAFQYRGRKFHPLDERPTCRVYPRLPRELEGEMAELLSVWDIVFLDEQPQVMAYISSVLNASDNPFDYLEKFPSGLRAFMQDLYRQLGIPVDGKTFDSVEPANGYREAYGKLCSRLTMNLLLE